MALIKAVVVFLFSVGLVRCDNRRLEWPAGCDSYNAMVALYPRVERLHHQDYTSDSACQELCTSRTDCGGYRTYRGEDSCTLYNMDDRIIREEFNENWYARDADVGWYSKSCPSNAAADTSAATCTDYSHVHENLIVRPRYRITFTYEIPAMSGEQCQRYCSIYRECKSVSFRYDTGAEEGHCELYNISVRELRDRKVKWGIREMKYKSDNEQFTTYDRYCDADTPYY